MPPLPLHEELAFHAPILGEPSLDAAHRALFATLARLAALPPADFTPAFDDCVDAMERDFRAEDLLMEAFDLPMLPAHREQHARMLAGLHHAAAALARGNAGPARHAVALLREWLPLHIETMDKGLVAAVARARALGAHAHSD